MMPDSLAHLPSFAAVLAFGLCLLTLPCLIILARRINLLDEPNYRKKHQTPTPLVGGVAIYIAVVSSVLIMGGNAISFTLLVWFGLVLAIGVLDDIWDVSYRVRIVLHALIVFGIWSTDTLLVTNIGAITGSNEIVFSGMVAVCFTVVAVVGAVNAVNMSDGVDGLLSSLCLASLVVIGGYASIKGGASDSINISGICIWIGSLFGFFTINSRFLGMKNAAAFLGDAGSTMLGFLMVYLLITFSQGESALFSPVVAGWLLGMPLLDAGAVIAARLLEGRAPFYPDRKHLHHLLIDAGVSVNRSVLVIFSVHIALLSVGIVSHSFLGSNADFGLFWAFVALVIARLVFGHIYSSDADLPASYSADESLSAKAYAHTSTPESPGSITVGMGLAGTSEEKTVGADMARDKKQAGQTEVI